MVPRTKPKKSETPGSTPTDHTALSLVMLHRFAQFLHASNGDVPLSFRQFMKQQDTEKGSHRSVAQAIENLESVTGRLATIRSILDDDGNKTGKHTSNFDEASGLSTRRESVPTEHGRLWGDVDDIIKTMVHLMAEGGDYPDAVRDALDRVHKELARGRNNVRRLSGSNDPESS